MKIVHILDRVYINIRKDFYEQISVMDLLDIIDEVAKSVKIYDGIVLYDCNTSKVYRKRTKRMIVREANRFISQFEELPADENMASYASMRQINRLIRAYKQQSTHISCYVLVYLHIMFKLVNDPERCDFMQFAETMFNVVDSYILNDSCDGKVDDLANFVKDCFGVVSLEFDSPKIEKKVEDFPSIPKRQSVSYNEE